MSVILKKKIPKIRLDSLTQSELQNLWVVVLDIFFLHLKSDRKKVLDHTTNLSFVVASIPKTKKKKKKKKKIPLVGFIIPKFLHEQFN